MSAAHPLPASERSPLAAAVARAPKGAPWTPEQRAELDQDMEDIRSGRAVLVPHELVHRTWEELRDGE